MRIRVPRTFVPPEAHKIAADFRRAARESRQLASQLRSVGGTLNSTWEGNSKNQFMGEFNPEPGNLDSYASYLEQCARNIEHIKVTIWEEKEVKDHK